jgi:hypothetical protein
MSGTRAQGIWSLVMAAAATVIAILSPLHVLIGDAPAPWIQALEYAVSILMAADVIVRWKHAGSLKAYGPGWFCVDVIAAIPFTVLFGFTLLDLLRLGKLLRVVQSMKKWWSQYVDKWNLFRLIYSGYWIGLVVHVLSCGWYAVRALTPGTHGAENSYIMALYWCVTTLTSVGYGDITPLTNVETVYAVFVMAAGVGMFGYVIGNIAHILANLHPSRVRYVETMEGINAFMEYRGLPARLQRRIRDFYSYRWEKRLGFDESAILDDLPPSLQGDVSLFLKRDVIEKVPFFQGATDELIREIALAMRPQVYMPGDLVFRAGEKGAEMFFIGRGEVEVLGKDGTTVQARLKDGQFFGEGALVLGQPRSASVRAVGFCDLYALDKNAFEGIIARYPEFKAHIVDMIRQRFGEPRRDGA